MNQPATSSGFDLNKPTIVALCYLAGFVLGFSGLVGIVLAFVWKGEAAQDPSRGWEASHYTYLINTFWIGLAGSIIGVILMVVLVGFLVLLATMALVGVRSVLSLINAQKQLPMPEPDTWKW